jgi:N-methylhydantoinase B
MATRQTHPLTVETFWSRLRSIVEQQAVALIRASFTPVVSECGDLSACVFDRHGLMLAQATTGTPGHINSMARCVSSVLEVFPPAELRAGDVLITNDPWLTSGHHYDITVITPVFAKGSLVAFFGNICHTADFGGRPFGPDGVDSFEEGLELPVLKLYREGQPNDDVFRIIEANVRYPEQVIGDLDAQVAGNAVGAQLLIELMAEHDVASIDVIGQEIIGLSERAMRESISRLPDGLYGYETWADGFDEPIRLSLTVRIDGDRIVADYTGTSPQVRQAINVVMNYTEAYTTFGIKCAVAPDVPNNEGSFRPVTVTAPSGSVLNCVRPAPVAARHLLGHFLSGMVLAALAPVRPEGAMAEGAGALWITNVHGTQKLGYPFSLISFHSGGTGGRMGLDGLSSTAYPSGVSGIPTEVFENRSPLVLLERQLRPDSGGPGTFRGGLGQRMVYSGLRLDSPYRLSPFADRVRHPAPGLMGGLAGAPGVFERPDGSGLDPKGTLVVNPGEDVVIATPGGGGLGTPHRRDPAAVLSDVLDGLVTPAQARDVYRVAITDAGSVDDAETERLRSGRDDLAASRSPTGVAD